MELIELARYCLPFMFALISLALCWFVYKKIQFEVWKLPPGPLGLPLLGSVPFLDKDSHTEFDRLSKIYGPLFSVSLGSFKTVVVSDYEYAKDLLSHPATLARPPAFFDFVPSKAGFASMNRDEWQEQRRFCIQTMRTLGLGKGPWEKIIQEDVAEFVEYLQKWKGKPVDINGPLTRSATSNNTALLTGRRFTKNETNPDVKVIERAHEVICEHHKVSNPAVLIPWLVKYLVKFNIAGYAEKAKALDNFANIFRREIKKHQESADYIDSTDFIGYYLEALKKNGAEDGSKKCFSVENLVGHMIALFIGASDTTTASIQWLLVLMAAYPEVQGKVQQELDDVIGRDGQICWNDRKKLPYTMATIFEMERWAVVVPFFPPRWTMETFEFRGYVIPKNTMIIGNSWTMHKDPKHWDNPDEYVPERFLQTAEKSGKDPSRLSGYAPFSFGKRNCPGETVAIMTIFLYFTGLMQKFTIKAPPGLRANLNTNYTAVIYPISQELCFIER